MMANIEDAKLDLRNHYEAMAPTYTSNPGAAFMDVVCMLLKHNPTPITAESIVHDNACGTGQVTVGLLDETQDFTPSVYATDFTPGMIAEMNKRSLPSSITTAIMDSQSLDFPDNFFTHSFASLLLFMASNPARCAKEIYRTLKPSGISLSSIFGSYGWAPIANQAIHAVRPDAPKFLGPPIPLAWSTPEWHKSLFVDAGFAPEKVKMASGRLTMKLKDMQSNREHFCNAIKLQASAGWTAEEQERLYQELLKAFDPEFAEVESFDHDILICIAEK